VRIYKWEIGILGKLGIAIAVMGPVVGFFLIVSGNLELDWISWVMIVIGWVVLSVDIFRHRKKRSAYRANESLSVSTRLYPYRG
jgi:hypothetical protein